MRTQLRHPLPRRRIHHSLHRPSEAPGRGGEVRRPKGWEGFGRVPQRSGDARPAFARAGIEQDVQFVPLPVETVVLGERDRVTSPGEYLEQDEQVLQD